MLSISDSASSAHAAASRQRFCESLRAHLQTLYPHRAADVDVERLDDTVRWAARYGVTRRYDVQRLAELLVEHNLPLEAPPTAAPLAQYFERSYPSGSARVDDMAIARLIAGPPGRA